MVFARSVYFRFGPVRLRSSLFSISLSLGVCMCVCVCVFFSLFLSLSLVVSALILSLFILCLWFPVALLDLFCRLSLYFLFSSHILSYSFSFPNHFRSLMALSTSQERRQRLSQSQSRRHSRQSHSCSKMCCLVFHTFTCSYQPIPRTPPKTPHSLSRACVLLRLDFSLARRFSVVQRSLFPSYLIRGAFL